MTAKIRYNNEKNEYKYSESYGIFVFMRALQKGGVITIFRGCNLVARKLFYLCICKIKWK